MVGSKDRVAFWDNAKFLMLVLVVAGHLTDGIRFDGLAPNAFYTLIYLFHMPVMIFITGYFSRPELSRKVVSQVVQLLATYLLWELLIGGFRYVLFDWTPPGSFISTPSSAMWFLLSLAWLKLLLPLFAWLRHPLLIAVVVSLMAGAFQDFDQTLSVMRTLSFLPFFVAGYVLKERGLLAKPWFEMPSTWLRLAAAAYFLVVTAILAFVLARRDLPALYRWEYRRYDYWQLTDSDRARIEIPPFDGVVDSPVLLLVNGVVVSGLLLILSVLISLAVMILVPRRHTWFTVMGENTLYIYLLHIPIIHAEMHHGVVSSVFASLGTAGYALVLLFAALLAWVLGSPLLKRVFRPIVEPNISLLVKP